MYLGYTTEQRALQQELRAYFLKLMTPEVRLALTEEEIGREDNVARDVRRQMGRDGWLGLGWPTEYGGRGMSAMEQFIFFDEANRVGAPLPFVALNTVGPTLMSHGSEEQKSKFLPRILSGEDDWSVGYSEPSAGTDLANLQTKAV